MSIRVEEPIALAILALAAARRELYREMRENKDFAGAGDEATYHRLRKAAQRCTYAMQRLRAMGAK